MEPNEMLELILVAQVMQVAVARRKADMQAAVNQGANANEWLRDHPHEDFVKLATEVIQSYEPAIVMRHRAPHRAGATMQAAARG